MNWQGLSVLKAFVMHTRRIFLGCSVVLVLSTAIYASDSIAIANPSFEEDLFDVWPGYVSGNSSITGWSSIGGGVGLNPVRQLESSPFVDQGQIPDGEQVAFMQTGGVAELSQVLSGLEVGRRYRVQIAANMRHTLDGTQLSGRPEMLLYYDDELIAREVFDTYKNPYFTFDFPFIPKTSSGRFRIVSQNRSDNPPSDKDRTLTLDAVSIIQRDVDEIRIFNPSFEASSSRSVSGDAIGGWAIGKSRFGSDVVSPSKVPDGRNALHLLSFTSRSQLLGGFVPGDLYELRYKYATNSTCAAAVTIGDSGFTKMDTNFSFLESTSVFKARSESQLLQLVVRDCNSGIYFDNLSIRRASQSVNWQTPGVIEKTRVFPEAQWKVNTEQASITVTPVTPDPSGTPCKPYSATTSKVWIADLKSASVHFTLQHRNSQGGRDDENRDTFDVDLITNRGRLTSLFKVVWSSGDSFTQAMLRQEYMSVDIELGEFVFTPEELEEPMEIRFRADDCDGIELGPVTIYDLVLDGMSDHRPGDFDANGTIDGGDIDALSSAARDNPFELLQFDVDMNGVVDDFDRQYWVDKLAKTRFGDADLNGQVEFSDFLQLSSSFGKAGGWRNGDFDGNGQIEFSDFLDLSSQFGKTRELAAVVPEPGSLWMSIACVAFRLHGRRLRRNATV